MIEARALAYRHPGGPELWFADLTVPAGGQLLLRGRSGAGKSTWLSLVAGLLTPTAGEVRVAGESVGALPPAVRDRWRGRHVGFLPQRLHLSAALSVAHNLALPYYAAGLPVDHARIAAVLDALGLQGLAQRRPQQLSGGQAQRVAVARAVLLRPAVLLADEPTASLDDEAAVDALALLARSAADCGACLVVATHDSRVAPALPGAMVHTIGAQPPSPVGAA